MIPQIRKYFIVTVHYGSAEHTNRLLASIQKNTPLPDKIIVVDHAATSFTPAVKNMPLAIIRPGENSGYAGGLNTAAGHLYSSGARGQDILICVNNDVEFPADAMAAVARAYAGKTRLGLWGPRGGTVNLLTGRATVGTSRTWPWHQTYIDGACFVVDLRTFFAAKGMPDQLFMYWEDVEFSRRVRASGHPVAVLPKLKVQHHPASHPSSDKTYYLVRNGAWYLANQTPLPWRLYWRCANAVRQLVHVSITHQADVVWALADARGGRLGKRPL